MASNSRNSRNSSPYKSSEAGRQMQSRTLSAHEWHCRFEPQEADILICNPDGSIEEKHYRYRQISTLQPINNCLTQHVIDKDKFIILRIIERPTQRRQLDTIFQNVGNQWHGHTFTEGSIGKTLACQLQFLFWKILNTPSQDVGVLIEHFNKLVIFCNEIYHKFPRQFETIKQACSKESPEDILQVIIIDSIGLWPPVITPESLLQFCMLALNRNFFHTRRANQSVTPDTFDIRKSLPGPLAVIFSTLYRETKNVTISLERLLREVISEMAIAFSDTQDDGAISEFMQIMQGDQEQVLSHTTENKRRSLKVLQVILKFVSPSHIPRVDEVWDACITEQKAKGRIRIGRPTRIPRWARPNKASGEGVPGFDNKVSIDPNNLMAWSGVHISILSEKVELTIIGNPINNGEDIGGTNIRLCSGNVTSVQPNGNDSRQNNCISGRGKKSVYNVHRRKTDYQTICSTAETLTRFNNSHELFKIRCERRNRKLYVVMTSNGGFRMTTEFDILDKIFITFKSIRDIIIEVNEVIEHNGAEESKDETETLAAASAPAAPAAPQNPVVNSMSAADMISSFMSSVTLGGSGNSETNSSSSGGGASTIVATGSSDGIPHEYKCPITQELMSDPVMAADGHSYERTAITQWIEQHPFSIPSSPVTNETMESTTLTSNIALKKLIADYTEANGIS